MVLDSIMIQSRAFALDEKDIKMEVEVMDAVASFVPDISSVNAKLKTHEGKQYTINGALLECYSFGWQLVARGSLSQAASLRILSYHGAHSA